jgi:hypothetical protein
MIRQRPSRTVSVVVGVVVFAIADAIIKGHQGGTRNAVGDISATWALVPFLAGAWLVSYRATLWGAIVGASSTAMALGVYTLARGSLYGGDGGHHALGTAVLANRWLLLGVAGGAVLGVVGAHLAARGAWTTVVAFAGSLLITEPVARMLWGLSRGEGPRTLLPSPAVWAVEIGCGCLIVATFLLLKVTRGLRR